MLHAVIESLKYFVRTGRQNCSEFSAYIENTRINDFFYAISVEIDQQNLKGKIKIKDWKVIIQDSQLRLQIIDYCISEEKRLDVDEKSLDQAYCDIQNNFIIAEQLHEYKFNCLQTKVAHQVNRDRFMDAESSNESVNSCLEESALDIIDPLPEPAKASELLIRQFTNNSSTDVEESSKRTMKAPIGFGDRKAGSMEQFKILRQQSQSMRTSADLMDALMAPEPATEESIIIPEPDTPQEIIPMDNFTEAELDILRVKYKL